MQNQTNVDGASIQSIVHLRIVGDVVPYLPWA